MRGGGGRAGTALLLLLSAAVCVVLLRLAAEFPPLRRSSTAPVMMASVSARPLMPSSHPAALDSAPRRRHALPLTLNAGFVANTVSDSESRKDAAVHVALVSHGWTAKGYHDASSIKGPGVSLRTAFWGILRAAEMPSVPRRLWDLPIVFHFVVGEDEERFARQLMGNATACGAITRTRFSATYTRLNTTQVDEWMAAIKHTATHRTAHAGNVKFFYALLWPRLPRVLMLDTDVLVAADVRLLYVDGFARMAPRQLFSLAPQWPAYDAGKDNQLNAGVGLLALDRMREAGWLRLAAEAIARWDGAGRTPRCCAHGDQSVFHFVRWWRPETLGGKPAVLLPRPWNANKCHGYQGLKSRAAQERALRTVSSSTTTTTIDTVAVGIVHLGCCKKCNGAKVGPVWAELFGNITGFADGACRWRRWRHDEVARI